jgi:hypothetical protein
MKNFTVKTHVYQKLNFNLTDIPAGEGKIASLFLQCEVLKAGCRKTNRYFYKSILLNRTFCCPSVIINCFLDTTYRLYTVKKG